MKLTLFALTITITKQAIIAFTGLMIGFVLLLPNNPDELYSDYAMYLGLIFAALSGIVGLLFIEVEGDIP
ncbi:MAG: hypothetical protein PHE67_03965 [Campylobacterales bacterium]|nr:hypothetical protein [Campylobacterales bacterium]